MGQLVISNATNQNLSLGYRLPMHPPSARPYTVAVPAMGEAALPIDLAKAEDANFFVEQWAAYGTSIAHRIEGDF